MSEKILKLENFGAKSPKTKNFCQKNFQSQEILLEKILEPKNIGREILGTRK